MNDQFSMQLYSARKFPPLNDTLKHLAELGYAEVEGFGDVYGNLDALVAGLNEAGLKMTSGHFCIDALENNVEGCLAIAKATGMKTMYCPAVDKDERVWPLQSLKGAMPGVRLTGLCTELM